MAIWPFRTLPERAARGKKKACGMFSTYCPFRGKPYELKRERS